MLTPQMKKPYESPEAEAFEVKLEESFLEGSIIEYGDPEDLE